MRLSEIHLARLHGIFDKPERKEFSQEQVWEAARYLGVDDRQALQWLESEEARKLADDTMQDFYSAESRRKRKLVSAPDTDSVCGTIQQAE